MRVVVVAVAVWVSSGCSARDVPYRFRHPLVGGVSASVLPEPDQQLGDDHERARAPTRRTRRIDTLASADPTLEGPRRRRLPALSSAAPSPMRSADEAVPLADVLRGFVGQRDGDGSHIGFVGRALRAIGAPIAADRELAAVTTGAALIRLAVRRGAADRPGPALLGDLLAFDGVVGREQASLVAVVVSRRPDDTIEFVYLARGVVRRGYVNPSYPSQKRGPRGRARNTLIRHTNGGDPRGTRYLAGHLLARVVRLDRLTARRVSLR